MHTVEIHVPEDADIEQAGSTIELEVGEDNYILAAARSTGLWLPADCQQGWCTTCAARLLEGDVDQSDSRRYYGVDADNGFTLICTAKPRSDVVIETHKNQEMLEHRAEHDLPPGNSKV